MRHPKGQTDTNPERAVPRCSPAAAGRPALGAWMPAYGWPPLASAAAGGPLYDEEVVAEIGRGVWCVGMETEGEPVGGMGGEI